MAETKIAHGKVRKYDGGKYQLRVDWVATEDHIKFRPYIVVVDSFKKPHKVQFSWKVRDKKAAEIADKKGDFVGEDAKEHTVTPTARKVQYSKKNTKNPKKDAKYYAGYKGKVKTKKVTTDEKVKIKKGKKKGKTVYVKARIPTSTGKWYMNYDSSIKINVKVGGDAKQSVTINSIEKPSAPKEVKVIMEPTSATIIPIDVHADTLRPITKIALMYKAESISESANDWSQIYPQEFNPPDLNGINVGNDRSFKFEHSALQEGHRYQYAVKTFNKTTSGEERDAIKANDRWWYTIPASVNSVSHEIVEDSAYSKNRIYITRDRQAIVKGIIKGCIFEVSNSFTTETPVWSRVDRDNLEGLADLETNINVNDAVVIDKNIKKDSVYRYRVKTFNYKDDSGDTTDTNRQISPDWVPSVTGTSITYTQPLEAKEVVGKLNDVKMEVELAIERQFVRTTADVMFIQRKADDGEWVDIGDSGGIQINPNIRADNTSVDKYTYKDDVSSLIDANKIVYRVSLGSTKAVIGDSQISIGNGRSEWKESAPIDLIFPPNPPRLVLPINNSYVTDEDSSIRFGWIHSPKDGTQQTGAVVQYRVKGTTNWQSLSVVGAAAYVEKSLAEFKVNDVIEWQVKTKGKHDNYSEFSAISTFKMVGYPKISWISPSSNSNVTNLPVSLRWSYNDPSGTCESMSLYIEHEDEIEYTMDLPTDTQIYELSDFLFDDDERYNLILVGKSTTGLEKSSTINVTIEYAQVVFTNGFTAAGTFDADTGYATCSINKNDGSYAYAIDGATQEEIDEINREMGIDEDADIIIVNSPVKKALLYRRYRGKKTLLYTFDDLHTAASRSLDVISAIDKYAPINREFEYVLLQQATTGEIGISSTPVLFNSTWWYIYYGYGDIAKARWNPSGSMALSRPEKQQIRYSGRTYPVTYDSQAVNETYSFNFTIFDEFDDGWDNIDDFRDMMESGGSGVWKSFEGDVYQADFDFNYSSDYKDGIRSWDCSLSVTRTEEEDTGFEYGTP